MLNVFVRVNVMPQRLFEENMVGIRGMIPVEFPSCIFLCGSLRSLIWDVPDVIMKSTCFPPSSSSSNLVCLKLGNLTIEDGDGFCKWVSFSCKSLKKLSLWGVLGLKNVTINSSFLEWLVIDHLSDLCHLSISCEKLESICVDWEFSKSTNSLNVFAPNLKYLKWYGNVMNYHSLGEFNCLEQVEVSFSIRGKGRTRDRDLQSKLDEFFSSIRRVKVLAMAQHTARHLMEEGFMHLLESFYNVQHLGVRIGSDIDDKMIPSLVSLLRAVPNFTTLDITAPRNRGFISGETTESSFSRGDWQLQELNFINRIRVVTIEITDGSNGTEFAKYVMENSPSLRKVIIICEATQKSRLMEEFSTSEVINPIMMVFHAQHNKYRVWISFH